MPTQVSIHYAFRHSVRITAAATTHVLKLTGLGLGLGSGLGLGLGFGFRLGSGLGLGLGSGPGLELAVGLWLGFGLGLELGVSRHEAVARLQTLFDLRVVDLG